MGVGFKVQKMGGSGLERSKNGWEWVGVDGSGWERKMVIAKFGLNLSKLSKTV